MVTAEGHTYLDAWCHSAEAPRLFRLDRIDRAEVLDDPGRDRRRRRPRDLGDGHLPAGPTGRHAGHPAAEPDGPLGRGVLPGRGSPPRCGQDRLEVDLLVADERWLTRLLLRLAPHAQVVSPARRSPRLHGRRTARRSACTQLTGRRTHGSRPTRTREDAHDRRSLIGGLGTPELLIILAVLVLLFGATKLPELARGSGRALRIFKAETKGLMDDDDDERRRPEDAGAARARGPAARPGQRQAELDPSEPIALEQRDAPRPEPHRRRAPSIRSRPARCRAARTTRRRRRPDGAVRPPA